MKTKAKTGILLGVIVLALASVLAYRALTSRVYSEANKPEGEAIVAALEGYKRDQGRFPDRLGQLVPKYLPATPVPAQLTLIAYAAPEDGSACWYAYQVHRDYYEEYDCVKRSWKTREYNDSTVMKHPRVEFIRGPHP